MEGVIADSSVWIDFFNQEGLAASEYLIESVLANELFICPIIVQEILQGIRDDEKFAFCQEKLQAIPMLKPDIWDASVGGASIYRLLRKRGITIRKPNDCLIAWYAISYDLSLLHNDRDFDLIAAHTPLKVISL